MLLMSNRSSSIQLLISSCRIISNNSNYYSSSSSSRLKYFLQVLGSSSSSSSSITTSLITNNNNRFFTTTLSSRRSSITDFTKLQLSSRPSYNYNNNTNKYHYQLQTKRMVQGVSIVDNHIININPATGEEISRIRCTTDVELDNIINNAVQAQQSWCNTPINERIQLLKGGLKKLSEKKDDIALMITKEMGKPILQSKEEMEYATDKDEYLNILENSLQSIQHGNNSIVVRQPLGVVTVLSPWNYPCDEILLLTLPALGSGNTVIVKPSEVTTEVGILTINALSSILPKNVLQIVIGDGTIGSKLVTNNKINMIAMTGSSTTGKKIMQSASSTMKRLVLELGGKDPMIVFDDVTDVTKAAHDAVKYSLSNTGQVCCSIERIYVAENIYEQFINIVHEYVKTSYQVGNGLDINNNIGPLVSYIQKQIVNEQVQDAIANGAKVIYQSTIPNGNNNNENNSNNNNFFPITVLADIQKNMKIYYEETFGPVICIIKFNGTEIDAIRLANDTEYGLAASVYTNDINKATRVANAIDAGQVGINCYSIENMNIACPWVGHKQSGYNYHSGKEGFHNFSIPKTLVYYDNDAPTK